VVAIFIRGGDPAGHENLVAHALHCSWAVAWYAVLRGAGAISKAAPNVAPPARLIHAGFVSCILRDFLHADWVLS
jgi:hypothetical protein